MTYAAAVLADSPTAFWPLSETSGTSAADATGNGHTGTYQRPAMVGARSWGALAAPDFTATSSDYVSVPASAALSSHAGASGLWSMDGMVYDDGSTDYQYILSVSYFPDGYEVTFRRDADAAGGQIFAHMPQASGSGSSINVADAYAPNGGFDRWYHVALTYDRAAKAMKVYVDGCLAGSDTTMTYTTSYTGREWRIGGREDSGDHRWDGSMSHIAIYPTCLSAATVKAHAIAAGITPPCDRRPTDGWSVGRLAW